MMFGIGTQDRVEQPIIPPGVDVKGMVIWFGQGVDTGEKGRVVSFGGVHVFRGGGDQSIAAGHFSLQPQGLTGPVSLNVIIGSFI